MPNLHDIERRINSVKSTKQITRTMEMVAAAKIRRATERVEAATPYSTSMMEMLGHLAAQTSGSEAPLLEVHENTNRVLIVVVVSDRGLAGGFNSNVLRRAEGLMREYKAAGAQVDVIACGKKAQGYFHYRKINPVLAFKDLSADPTVEEAEEVAKYAIDGYSAGTLDKVVIVYNHAKNAAEQVLTEEVVLPVDAEAFASVRQSGQMLSKRLRTVLAEVRDPASVAEEDELLRQRVFRGGDDLHAPGRTAGGGFSGAHLLRDLRRSFLQFRKSASVHVFRTLSVYFDHQSITFPWKMSLPDNMSSSTARR